MSPAPGPDPAFDRDRRRGEVQWVVGVDEVGRGCLAGPVVAAAVVFAADSGIAGIRDSKTLAPAERARLAGEIRRTALSYGLSFVRPRVIDAINIRRASLQAMACAVARAVRLGRARGLAASSPAWTVLVDGIDRIPGLGLAQESVVSGDALSESIAAASVVAKASRDAFMVRLGAEFPAYAFERNRGYGTPDHLGAIDRVGPCAWHRRSFAPIAQLTLALDEAP